VVRNQDNLKNSLNVQGVLKFVIVVKNVKKTIGVRTKRYVKPENRLSAPFVITILENWFQSL